VSFHPAPNNHDHDNFGRATLEELKEEIDTKVHCIVVMSEVIPNGS
jgi:hypothetical protein